MIRVLLAEDMHMVRGALVALLDLEPDIEVVAEVEAGDQIVPMVERHAPDVAVIDIDLPVLDGLTAAGTIRLTMPGVRTLMLTTLARPGTLRRALAAGVDGFILKDAPPEELAAAIRDVAAGRRFVDSQLVLAAWDRGKCPLTERELEVLRLAADGTDVGDIALALSLSVGTVRNYLTAIVAKLGARNRVDAVRIADAAGWL
ncbi:response regulator transcription factor [Saccharothrix syringae]|uniref:Response regulator transcription factor n=1 Tax=Saccharothrix syringae TaxID=103733 RepID=A0A5Q0H5Y3_SACSY|nr:response regulator transcription factor [Saccharothrix syringae]QFZ21152.1 response regulator transcription factor [Saccharothrix syringae]